MWSLYSRIARNRPALPHRLDAALRRTAVRLSLAYLTLPLHSAGAQDYLEGSYDEPLLKERTAFQMLLLTPAATFMMVLLGAGGVYNFFIGSGKVENGEKKQALGMMMLAVVFLMVYFRWSIWSADYQHHR